MFRVSTTRTVRLVSPRSPVLTHWTGGYPGLADHRTWAVPIPLHKSRCRIAFLCSCSASLSSPHAAMPCSWSLGGALDPSQQWSPPTPPTRETVLDREKSKCLFCCGHRTPSCRAPMYVSFISPFPCFLPSSHKCGPFRSLPETRLFRFKYIFSLLLLLPPPAHPSHVAHHLKHSSTSHPTLLSSIYMHQALFCTVTYTQS